MKLLFATRNRGKLRELHALLVPQPAGLELLGLDDIEPTIPELEETGATFAENASAKARAAANASGLLSLADDSGLEVDALAGEPGVHSARYAGPGASDATRIQLLLQKLRDVPAGARRARFRCVVALCDPGRPDSVELREGSCEGEILFAPRGSGGFGYDPVYKNRVSHRGRAMRQMAELLQAVCRQPALELPETSRHNARSGK